MENKDTNTDYQKIVRVGDQKWEIVEIIIEYFFCLRFVFNFFIQGVVKSQLKKSPPPKVPSPIQNPDLT